MPRAFQTVRPQMDKNPEDRLGVNVHKNTIDLKAIAEMQVQGLLNAIKLFTGLDLGTPTKLLESLAAGAAGFGQAVLTAITNLLGFDLSTIPAKLGQLEDAVEHIPVIGDIVKALTGKTGGLADLQTWAGGLEAQAEQAAHDAISDVNTVVGQLAHDAGQVGESLAQTIGGVIDLLAGTHQQTQQNAAAITALSSIAPTSAVTSLAASTDPNDIPAFDRILMLPVAKTDAANGANGAHSHTIASDAYAYTPGDKELTLILIRSDRKQPVNALKIMTAATGWSLTGVDQLLVSAFAYSEPDAALKLLYTSGDQKNTVTTAAQEYVVGMGQTFDVLPGHVLAVGVWQTATFLIGAPRKLAGIPQVGVKPRTGAPIKAVLGKITGQSSVPATIPLASITWNYNAAVWGALTLA